MNASKNTFLFALMIAAISVLAYLLYVEKRDNSTLENETKKAQEKVDAVLKSKQVSDSLLRVITLKYDTLETKVTNYENALDSLDRLPTDRIDTLRKATSPQLLRYFDDRYSGSNTD